MAKLKGITIAGQKFEVEGSEFKDYKRVGLYFTNLSSNPTNETLSIKLTNNQSVMNFFTTHQAKFNNIALFAGTDLIYQTAVKIANPSATHQNAVQAGDPSFGSLRNSGGVILFILATCLGIRTKFREMGDDFDDLYGDTAFEFYYDFPTSGYRQLLNDAGVNDYDLLNTPGEIVQLTTYLFDTDINNRSVKHWKKNNEQGTIQEFLSTITPMSELGSNTAFAMFTFVFEKIK